MIKLNIHIDSKKITSVQADGLIISTPTGSTAYSVSAGGPLIAPTVPSFAITPICPHTLSFRPVIIPESSIIYVTVPMDARITPELSHDGKYPIKLKHGDIMVLTASNNPVSTYKQKAFQENWFYQLVSKFNWNQSQQFKQLDNQNNNNNNKTNNKKYTRL